MRELWALRAHAIAGWNALGDLADAAGARLYLVNHAPEPGSAEIETLGFLGYPVAAPREIRLTGDRVALAFGITPEEGWGLAPPGPRVLAVCPAV